MALQRVFVAHDQVSFLFSAESTASPAPYWMTTRPVTTKDAPNHHSRDTDSPNRKIPNNACMDEWRGRSGVNNNNATPPQILCRLDKGGPTTQKCRLLFYTGPCRANVLFTVNMKLLPLLATATSTVDPQPWSAFTNNVHINALLSRSNSTQPPLKSSTTWSNASRTEFVYTKSPPSVVCMSVCVLQTNIGRLYWTTYIRARIFS